MDKQLKNTLNNIANRISFLRKKHGISQEELAHMAGIDRTYVGYIENSKHNITLGVLIKIASALEVPLTDLIDTSENISLIKSNHSFRTSTQIEKIYSKHDSKIIAQAEIEVHVSDQNFNAKEKNLIQSAIKISNNAYAPYSNFKVGSAVLLANDKIICGSNQENAVFPIGLCAERVALFSASNNYPNVPIIALALYAKKELKQDEFPVFPCGSCRHSIIEQEFKQNNKIKLFITGSNQKIFVIRTVQDILPFAFMGDSLIE